MLYEVTFAHGWSFRTADDPIPPMSLVFEVASVLQVQPTYESRSQNSEAEDGSGTDLRKSNKQIQEMQEYIEKDVYDECK